MKKLIYILLLTYNSYASNDFLSVSIDSEFTTPPSSIITNKYAWVIVKYSGKATNYWGIRFLMFTNLFKSPILNDIYMTNLAKDFPSKPENYKKMVWCLPSTEKQAFFFAELIDEK